MFQVNVAEKIKTHILRSIPCSRKSCRLWENVEKYGRARQATGGNIIRRMRCACWITKATDTHSEIFNTYRFFTATMVTRTRLSVRLHVHCVPYVTEVWIIEAIPLLSAVFLLHFVSFILLIFSCRNWSHFPKWRNKCLNRGHGQQLTRFSLCEMTVVGRWAADVSEHCDAFIFKGEASWTPQSSWTLWPLNLSTRVSLFTQWHRCTCKKIWFDLIWFDSIWFISSFKYATRDFDVFVNCVIWSDCLEVCIERSLDWWGCI